MCCYDGGCGLATGSLSGMSRALQRHASRAQPRVSHESRPEAIELAKSIVTQEVKC